MKHEQENMKELLKKKYFSPLIESYDMVGEKILDGSIKATNPNYNGDGNNIDDDAAKYRPHFGLSHFYENGYDE